MPPEGIEAASGVAVVCSFRRLGGVFSQGTTGGTGTFYSQSNMPSSLRNVPMTKPFSRHWRSLVSVAALLALSAPALAQGLDYAQALQQAQEASGQVRNARMDVQAKDLKAEALAHLGGPALSLSGFSAGSPPPSTSTPRRWPMPRARWGRSCPAACPFRPFPTRCR